MDLYHYTCAHGRIAIEASGRFVIPATSQTGLAFGLPGEFAWFTDLDAPIRDALGLTSHTLSCDRTAHRFRVLDASPIVPWMSVRRAWSWAEELESAPDARPMHWFVATEPVAVTYDALARAG